MLFQRLMHGGLALILLFGPPSMAMAANLNFSGEVTYLERIDLPAGSELVVTLVALPEARPIVSAAAAIAASGRIPLQFSLNLDSNVIAANRQYGLIAEIRSAQGTLFRNAQPVAVDPAFPTPTTIVVSLNANPQPDKIVTVPPVEPAAVAAPVQQQPVAAAPVQPPAEIPQAAPVEPVAPPLEAPVAVAPVEPAPPPEATAKVEPETAMETTEETPEEDTAAVAVVEEPANPLLDTAWQVIGIGGDPILPDTEVTLAIAGDGRASGSGGCNNYFAEASFHTMPLFFGPVASTRMACEPPAMEQESAYFAALDTVVSYELEGNSLSLLNAMAVPIIELTRE